MINNPFLPKKLVGRQAELEQISQILLEDGDLRFMPVKLGAVDLKGRVQVLEGLRGGESIILYSRKSLSANSRIDVIDEIQGARQ